MDVIYRPSPNVSDRPAGCAIDTIVLHYTGMKTAQDALDRLCASRYEVSAHYLADENGDVYALAPEYKKAWHAGISSWRGKSDVNENSVGIEIVNPGHEFGYRPFPDAQIASVIALCRDVMRRHAVPARNVVGHSDVAPNRKQDPGELFPWKTLAEEGVGEWPSALNRFPKENGILFFPYSSDPGVRDMQRRLREYGYFIRADGVYAKKTEAVVRAFKRRFVPHALSVTWDEHSEYALSALEA
ncbi:MAG: N-acetylmuramoyl-L-alanine amidase [Rickettsiales bacterium]